MSKPVILTGIRANNDLTIGNYFGAILPMIDMAKSKSDEFQINMFIPDLHSFTTPIDHSALYNQVLHNARLFIAAGLPIDNDNIYIYRQSYIPAHSELTWILDCFTGFGEMSRMTQFKDKTKKILDQDSDTANLDEYQEEFKMEMGRSYNDRISVGLFNYPVLMAADILLYNAQYVPVGEDQSQHLEFTRDIGERINSRFGNVNGDVFTLPESVKQQHEFFGQDKADENGNHQGLRIKDLIDPTRKMSKSEKSDRGVIFLGDDPDEAYKKVMGATTDDLANIDFNRDAQPGISNLLEILSLLRGVPLDDVITEFKGQTSYGDFKKVVAEAMKSFLTGFQAKLLAVDDATVLSKLEDSEHKLIPVANETLLRAQIAVGLRPKAN